MIRRLTRRAAALVVCVAGPILLGQATTAHASPSSTVPIGTMVRLSAMPLGFEYGCSIGLSGTDRAGHQIAVTAGHCAGPHMLPAYLNFNTKPSGQMVDSSPARHLDYAAIRLDPAVHVASSTLGPLPEVGEQVCKTGRVTGRTCGPVTAVTPTTIVADLRTFWGDSGGQLTDHAGRGLGILSRTETGTPLPGDPTAAIRRELTSFANPTAPPPASAVFIRADKIARNLHHSIGFHTGGPR